jgi:hypothetical protein
MTDYSRLQVLRNQIDCLNRLEVETERIRQELQAALAPFMGKKIYKFTGDTFTAAARTAADKVNCPEGIRLWFTFSISSIYCSLQASYRTSDVSVGYCEKQFFVAAFDSQTGIMNDETRSTEKPRIYELDDVLETRQAISELESQLSSLKSSISAINFRYC